MHPVGPLPASTYWRRRAVLVLGLVVLLLLLKSCAGGGSPKKKTGSVKPSPSATAGPTTRPSSTPSRTPVASGGTCADADLRLDLKTDQATYPVGTNPEFTLTVTNASATACKRDLGAKAVAFTVRSGAARTWSSDDCSNGNDSAVTTLQPGKVVLVNQYHWNGLRSRPGCPKPREQATAGTYQVTGTVGTLTSAKVVFHFR